MLENERELVLT